MKADRLLSILLLLQTRGRVSATELAERLEVSVRTIYRDVESLSAAGVPVFTERGRHGGISLLPGYRTDVTGLTADEARALFVLSAQGAHSDLGLDGALGSALRKVMAALPPRTARPRSGSPSASWSTRPAGCRAARRPVPRPARNWANCSTRCSPTGGCGCATGTAARPRRWSTPSTRTGW